MPRASSKSPETSRTTSDKLDDIIAILHRLDRRDRARMIGSLLHSFIWVLMAVFFFWSTWYLFEHSGEVIGLMSERMVEQMYGENSQQDLMQQLQEYLGQ